MVHDKKRASLQGFGLQEMSSGSNPSSFSTASALSRQPLPGRSGYNQLPQNTPSTSSFFTEFPLSNEPDADPEMASQFAYSTTLRRHTLDGQALSPTQLQKLSGLGSSRTGEGTPSLLDRVLSTVSGSSTSSRAEYGHVNGTESPTKSLSETPASKYAHFSVEDVLDEFRSSSTQGLSQSDIPALRELHGYNEFTVSATEPLLLKFAKTIYESPLILLLFGSALVSAVMGNIDDAVSITIAILIVLTVGFVQERRSEKSLEALNKLVPHHCHLIRDGRSNHVLANELLPGDLVTFSVGDRIPADLRIITANDLEIDESSLTGETRPASKNTKPCDAPHLRPGETAALAERTCIAYMGTLVRNGRGSGVVIGTGTDTEFGAIFSMMESVEEKRTPLQLKMDELAKTLSFMSFGVIGVICIIGALQQRPWLEMFTIGVSLAVAAIPEGLPIVTTVTLALGVLRMSRSKAIVKKLPSVEALGSVSVICSDKTGTLTKNEQTVTEIYTIDETLRVESPPFSVTPAVEMVLQIGCVCNNAFTNEDGVYVGHSTDVALLNVLAVFNRADERKNFSRLSERPFNSEQKYMAVSGVHFARDRRERCYVKGALEVVLDRCNFYYVSPESSPTLDGETRSMVLLRAKQAAERGLRVIALAYGHGSVDDSSMGGSGGAPTAPNLVFVGFQAMLDPPRKGVAEAVDKLQSGGVQIVMITGDSKDTALSIAQQLKLKMLPGMQSVITGQELDNLTTAQLRERVRGVTVFARTTPRHKMAIVDAFQSRGAVVAMTGDGVNDAPALKMADIGVSMGVSGTDVAKEAADVILVDDNFATIISAVEEGKSIFHNIQNFLAFQLSTAVAALTLITLSTFFGLSNPLNAMQILFINILMDGPPSQSLGVDPVDPTVMRKPPRKKDEPIISRRLIARVLFSASIIVSGTLFIYAYAPHEDGMSRRDQTMTFTCFVFLDLVSALQNRGLGCGLTQNKMLLTTISVSFATQLLFIYVPFLQAIFQTEALIWADLSTLLLLGLTSMALHEARRRYEQSLEASVSYATITEELA